MEYKYDDGGRAAAGFKGTAGDCVCRSIAIVSERPYAEIYKALANGAGNERKTRGRSARNGIHVRRKWFKDYMRSLGFVFTPTMGIGTGCRVHLRADELPPGRLIVAVSKHYTAVIDGVIHDIFDPSERGTTIYSPPGGRSLPAGTPEPERPADVPKGACWLANGNGWAYSPERCVYGFWRMA